MGELEKNFEGNFKGNSRRISGYFWRDLFRIINEKLPILGLEPRSPG
jgi:hypothetical protein